MIIQRLKLTGAAILVFQASTSLQADWKVADGVLTGMLNRKTSEPTIRSVSAPAVGIWEIGRITEDASPIDCSKPAKSQHFLHFGPDAPKSPDVRPVPATTAPNYSTS